MSSYVNANGEAVEAGNVFFGTTARLVPQDTDEEGDVYDARIDGGFPEPAGKGPCKGNACESPVPTPLFQAPATNTLASSGDITPEPTPSPSSIKKATKKTASRCKRGYVRKKVKRKTECVRSRKATKSTKQRGR